MPQRATPSPTRARARLLAISCYDFRMGKWFFSAGDDGVVHMMARFEGDGCIGDAHEAVGPGESFEGIPHDALLAARSGVLVWERERWRISAAE